MFRIGGQASLGSCDVSKPYWARCSDAHGNGLPGDVLQLKTLLIRQRTGKAFHQPGKEASKTFNPQKNPHIFLETSGAPALSHENREETIIF